MREDIASIRKEYTQAKLDEDTILKDPFKQFEKWFNEALKSEIVEPTAMVLSTADQEGRPFQRTVLLKMFGQDGFIFYTNYESRKSRQINENPQVSILFPWYTLERQVAITGSVEKVSTKQSLKYFLSRPKGSQLGAWVSNQSEVISSRSVLEAKLEQMKKKFKEGKIPLPDNWGGYRIIPNTFEFWQGRKSRLHDRFYFEQDENGSWKSNRLAP
ncbi:MULTISPECIES: pyridoxamine 5'-phosphate oxidase [unclassified Ekhidna]|jgi:pyridoxamine 5'-phosphate oxidase|uniref:pyridoxamine 5'-phosphate oxidase n=1 Tax=unclassified Ekhidna TaxID=2632188 RepID=UPI0032DF80A9